MKSKQSNPKSVRQLTTTSAPATVHKQRVRCSLCDALLKASSTHRYVLTGKSAHDNLDKDLTYGECCKRYVHPAYESNRLQMLCSTCCAVLQRVHSLHQDAEVLTGKIRHTWCKTKRLHRARQVRFPFLRVNGTASTHPVSTVAAAATNEPVAVSMKKEVDDASTSMKMLLQHIPATISTSVAPNIPFNLPTSLRPTRKTNALRIPFPPQTENADDTVNPIHVKPPTFKKTSMPSKKPANQSHASRKSQLTNHFPSMVPVQPSRSILPSEQEYYPNAMYRSSNNGEGTSPYAQLLIETPSPSSSSSSHQQQHPEHIRRNSSDTEEPPSAMNYEQSIDGDRSLSPTLNDDQVSCRGESKNARLSRRQYDFQVKLPDQQSLNTFIESSATESGSRWTWRRTSANSRGYKVYYVCNFSMRRHYHPCPAAMYALFHPEGSISIYACGEHQHIPKDRLPVSITDATKDEIFKCLQSGMATTDIREHLTRLHLPFGDTRKLNNFIKYHKELLRFGTVTNVRIGGTAYRQPQCWAIRRQPSVAATANAPSPINNDTPSTESIA